MYYEVGSDLLIRRRSRRPPRVGASVYRSVTGGEGLVTRGVRCAQLSIAVRLLTRATGPDRVGGNQLRVRGVERSVVLVLGAVVQASSLCLIEYRGDANLDSHSGQPQASNTTLSPNWCHVT